MDAIIIVIIRGIKIDINLLYLKLLHAELSDALHRESLVFQESMIPIHHCSGARALSLPLKEDNGTRGRNG